MRPEIKALVNEAAAALGYNHNELLRRSRSWLLTQPRAIQLWAVGLQEPPSEEARERVVAMLDRVAASAEAAKETLAGRHGGAA